MIDAALDERFYKTSSHNLAPPVVATPGSWEYV